MSHYFATDREALNGGKRGPECGCFPLPLPAITILEGSPLEPFILQEPLACPRSRDPPGAPAPPPPSKLGTRANHNRELCSTANSVPLLAGIQPIGGR